MADWQEAVKKFEHTPPLVVESGSETSLEAVKRTIKTSVGVSKVKTIKATTTPSNHDTTIPLITTVRRAVKELGKEAATYRFTKEEKDKLKDLVYIYGRQGIKTSENEITRIALNWLTSDHDKNGENSFIYLVLKALKE